MQPIIFTDLDGTLLDYKNYSYEGAKEALRLLKEQDIPLIICTSKTKAETRYWSDKIGFKYPFIAENGGAVFIPKDFFSFKFRYEREDGNFYVIEHGTRYEDLQTCLKAIKQRYDVKGFSDMDIEEVAKKTGLPPDQARLAKMREYTEPFIASKEDEDNIKKRVRSFGLRLRKGGLFNILLGDNDKGEAVKMLSEMLKKKYGSIRTIGLGDAQNDFDMLDIVDKAYLIDNGHNNPRQHSYNTVQGISSKGWNHAIIREVSKLND